MNKALKHLEGEHDFSSFKCVRTQNPSKKCILYLAKCRQIGDDVVIDIVGNRFLYNMIRIIVGTLLMFSKDQVDPFRMQEILTAKDRSLAGPTISPQGLTLMYVGYNDDINKINEKVNKEANKDENIFC